MPHSTIKYPLTFSLFVGVMSTIAIFCTLTGVYIALYSGSEMQYDKFVLWAVILPISLLLGILLGKHCYRKTAPEYINTVFKGKMGIAYSVLISILIAIGMFCLGLFLTSMLNGFAGKSFDFIKISTAIYAVVCFGIGIVSGIFSYKKVKSSVVDENIVAN